MADQDSILNDIFDDLSEFTDDESRGPLSKKRQEQLAAQSQNTANSNSQVTMNKHRSNQNTPQASSSLSKGRKNKKLKTSFEIPSSKPASMTKSVQEKMKKKKKKKKKKRKGSLSDTSSQLTRTISSETAGLDTSSRLINLEREAQTAETTDEVADESENPPMTQEEIEVRIKEPEMFGVYESEPDIPELEAVDNIPQDTIIEHTADQSLPKNASPTNDLTIEDGPEESMDPEQLDARNPVDQAVDVDAGLHACPSAIENKCARMFATEKAAMRHARRTHTSTDDLKCNVCDKVLSRKDKLKAHMARHTEAEIEDATNGRSENLSEQAEEQTPLENAAIEDESSVLQVLPSVDGIEKTADHSVSDSGLGEPLENEHASQSVTDQTSQSIGLKRKRTSRAGVSNSPARSLGAHKRQKTSSGSDSDMNDDEADSAARKNSNQLAMTPEVPVQDNRQGIHATLNEINQNKPLRNGNLDGFVRKNTAPEKLLSKTVTPSSSRLSRPSKQLQELLRSPMKPLTPARIPKVYSVKKNPTNENSASYTGKQKAVDIDADPLSDSEMSEDVDEPQELATTVAKKTQRSRKLSRKSLNNNSSSDVDADSSQSDEPVSDADDDTFHSSVSVSNTKESKHKCRLCSRTFSSEKAREFHEQNELLHQKQYHCSDCPETFNEKQKLVKHTETEGHTAANNELVTENEPDKKGITGKFSDTEYHKMMRWRERVCKREKISKSMFNEMMTQAGKRGINLPWEWMFITKSELLEEYYDQLPSRNRRSMIRFRERNFQNVDRSAWNEDDDSELKRLYNIHGAKWVEIGQAMNRTQDSVQQRWKNKLNYDSDVNHGEWQEAEVRRLMDAIEAVAEQSNVDMNQDPPKISWDMVSARMEHKRTAQQCSNKYRVQTTRRVNGKFVKTPNKSSTPKSTDRSQSKMTKRLEGNPSSAKPKASNKAFKSDERIIDSDESAGSEEEVEVQDVDDIHVTADAIDAAQNSSNLNGNLNDEDSAPSSSSFNGQLFKNRQEQTSRKDVHDLEADTPIASKNPFNAKTPINNLGLTQVYHATQANSSAKRMDTGSSLKFHPLSEERPSPNLTYKNGTFSSPLRPMDNSKLRYPVLDKQSVSKVDDVEEDSQAESGEDEGEPEIAGSSQSRVRSPELPLFNEAGLQSPNSARPVSKNDSAESSAASTDSNDTSNSGSDDETDDETSNTDHRNVRTETPNRPSSQTFWSSVRDVTNSIGRAFRKSEKEKHNNLIAALQNPSQGRSVRQRQQRVNLMSEVDEDDEDEDEDMNDGE